MFVNVGDPIASGFVTNLARPAANVTGVSFLTQMLGSKRVGLLNMLAPDAPAVAVLGNPMNPGAQCRGQGDRRCRARRRAVILNRIGWPRYQIPMLEAVEAERRG